jgi:hypothetical protein
MSISQLAEELFPFLHYLARVARQRRHCESSNILKESEFAEYVRLSREQLSERLKEERARATALDDKTFKLTLSISVGLTVLGSTAAFLIKEVTSPTIQTTLTIAIGVTLFYVLAAGFIALGALRTLPSYGYGTLFLLEQHASGPEGIADALARQELMNNIRHLRNETAYQSLRNGLVLLFAGLVLFAMTLAYQSFCPVVSAGPP